MYPDPTFAVARSHEQDMRRHAEAARQAKAVRTPSRPHIALPQIKFSRRVGAVRARIAHA